MEETKILQNAYSEWLSDIFKKEPRRKKRNGNQSGQGLPKLERVKPRVRKVQSAKECIRKQRSKQEVHRPISVQSSREKGRIVRERKFEQIKNEINFTNFTYRKGWQPGAGFFKWLMCLNKLPCKLPNTFVVDTDDGGDKVYLWVHDNAVQVYRYEQQVRKKWKDIQLSICQSDHQAGIVAVTKSSETEFQTLSTVEQIGEHMEQMVAQALIPDSCKIVQKFVHCKGTTAWFVRTMFKRNQVTTAWIVSTKNAAIVQLDDPENSTIVKSATTASWSEPKKLMETLVKSLETSYEISFNEFVGDMILDRDGVWSLLQVKGYLLRSPPRWTSPFYQNNRSGKVTVPVNLIQISKNLTSRRPSNGSGLKKDECPGNYCNLEQETGQSKSDEVQFISYKDMLSCHFTADHEQQSISSLSYSDFSAGLVTHLNNISRKQKNKLYERISICENCLPEYLRLLRLKTKYSQHRVKMRPTKIETPSSPAIINTMESCEREFLDELEANTTDNDFQPSYPQVEELNELESLVKNATPQLYREAQMDEWETPQDNILSQVSLSLSSKVLESPSKSKGNADILKLSKSDNISISQEIISSQSLELQKAGKDNTDETKPTEFAPTIIEPRIEPRQEVLSPRLSENWLDEYKSLSIGTSKIDDIWNSKMPGNKVSDSLNESASKSTIARGSEKYLPVQDIVIDSCQSIYFNERYKEDLLFQARELFDLSNKVRFVVPAASNESMDDSAKQMALRSIHLDLRAFQSAKNEDQTYQLPDIERDSKGNMYITISP